MITLHILDSAGWHQRPLFLLGPMTRRTQSTGKRYGKYSHHHAIPCFLTCCLDKKIPSARRWCHASHEQHHRVVHLQQCHSRNCCRVQHHQPRGSGSPHFHFSHRVHLGTSSLGSQFRVLWPSPSPTHRVLRLHDLHSSMCSSRLVCITAGVPSAEWNDGFCAHCYRWWPVCGCPR